MRDRLYLKVDDESRAEYEEHGSAPFQMGANRKSKTFYELPDEVASDDAELVAWAHRAIEAARIHGR
jgi:TfoX/Sxy family transcriptional regulator of competence genes